MIGLIKKYLPIFTIIVLLTSVLYFVGIPALDILGNEGYQTQSFKVGVVKGNPDRELILPETRKGFLTSYLSDALSETITVQGTLKLLELNWVGYYGKVWYVVKFRSNPYENWEIISEPGHTVSWVTPSNPGKMSIPDFDVGQTVAFNAYSFNLIGSREGAIRVEFWMSWKDNAFWGQMKNSIVASDQAYIFSGKCGLWYPKDENGQPVSTFEVGSDVSFEVETGVGNKNLNTTAFNDRIWVLKLRKPDGIEYKEQNFPRYLPGNFRGTVTFHIYSDMFNPGGDNTWSVELWNELLPKGQLKMHTIDILALAPSDVTITTIPETSVKVGNPVTVTLQANQNPETQLPVTYFEVMVFYGRSNELPPGDWSSSRWILHETKITATDYGNGVYKGSFSFTPNREGWVKIQASAHDTGGRDSKTINKYMVKAFETTPPSSDEIKTENAGKTTPEAGGVSGESSEWINYIIGGGSNGEDRTLQLIYFIIGLITLIIFLLIGLLLPLPFQPYSRILLIVLGFIITFYIWVVL